MHLKKIVSRSIKNFQSEKKTIQFSVVIHQLINLQYFRCISFIAIKSALTIVNAVTNSYFAFFLPILCTTCIFKPFIYHNTQNQQFCPFWKSRGNILTSSCHQLLPSPHKTIHGRTLASGINVDSLECLSMRFIRNEGESWPNWKLFPLDSEMQNVRPSSGSEVSKPFTC